MCAHWWWLHVICPLYYFCYCMLFSFMLMSSNGCIAGKLLLWSQFQCCSVYSITPIHIDDGYIWCVLCTNFVALHFFICDLFCKEGIFHMRPHWRTKLIAGTKYMYGSKNFTTCLRGPKIVQIMQKIIRLQNLRSYVATTCISIAI